MLIKKAIVAALLTAALAGCAQTEGQQRATTGALIGGAGGALVGQAIGGNTKSTVIGAASGALLGAVVGSATTPQRRSALPLPGPLWPHLHRALRRPLLQRRLLMLSTSLLPVSRGEGAPRTDEGLRAEF